MGARAVVFDWSGTVMKDNDALVASCRSATESVLGQTYPATPPEEQMLFQLGELETLRMLCDGSELFSLAAAAFDRHYRNAPAHPEPYEDVDIVLRGLREAGWTLVVVSNGERDRVLEAQRRTGLDALIDLSVFIDESPSWIPHPAPLLAALDAVDAHRRGSVMVGDAPADLRAGRAAGMMTAAALYGYQSDQLHGEEADIFLDSPLGLLDALLHTELDRSG